MKREGWGGSSDVPLILAIHEMLWFKKRTVFIVNENTSSGTDKASLSSNDIFSLENEKATLLI